MIEQLTVRQSMISSIISYCPRQAELEYIDHLSHRTALPLQFGGIYHAVLAWYFQNRIDNQQPTVNDLIDTAISYIDRPEDVTGNDKLSSWSDVELGESRIADVRRDIISCLLSYFPMARALTPIWSELAGSIEISGVTITSHLDLIATTGIKEFKTSRTYVRRGNQPYFPDYGLAEVLNKPQPYLHLLMFGNQNYEYHVAGKSEQEHVAVIPVKHTKTEIEQWRIHTLLPTINMITAGLFPAKRSSLCQFCPWSKDTKQCGMLA